MISRKLKSIEAATKCFSLGTVVSYEFGEATIDLQPREGQVVAEVGTSTSGLKGGVRRNPVAGDLCLVAMIDGDLNNAFVICWFDDDPETYDEIKDGVQLVRSNTDEDLNLETDNTKMEMTASGTIEFETPHGKLLETLSDSIGLMSEICTTLLSSTTSTFYGPQPLINGSSFGDLSVKIVELKQVLDNMRVK